MRNRIYKIRLYPSAKQQIQIQKTIDGCRFLYNQMLEEKIRVFEELKNDKLKLYAYKYKSEKEYKIEFLFLKDCSSAALQYEKINLYRAFQNFYRGLKNGNFIGFPKFKSKRKDKSSYREPQIGNTIRIKNNQLHLLKLGWINFKGLTQDFNGTIKSVTIEKERTGCYFASILVKQEDKIKKRISDNIIGIDLGLNSFVATSEGDLINSIKSKLYFEENKIKKLSRKLARQRKQSNRFHKNRIRIAKLHKRISNIRNHFHWHIVNKLCSENKVIIIEDLSVKNMIQNRKIARSISYAGWSSFINKLKQKSVEYESEVIEVPKFFPSSKLCSSCGETKQKLSLSDRVYDCDCGNNLNRDYNAAINLRNWYFKNISAEYVDYERRESVRLLEFDFKSKFVEAFKFEV